jgi:hypothetical protein
MSTGGGDETLQVGLLLDVGPAIPSVAQAVGLFGTILDSLRQARDMSDAWAQSTFNLRESLRDIAQLQGKSVVTDEFLRSQLGVMRATGMTATESHKFQEQFLGEAAAYTSRLAPGEMERLTTLGGQYATTLGPESIGTMAQLYGRIIGANQAGGQTAQGVVGEAAEVYRILQAGSGAAPLILQSMMNVAPELGAGMEGGQVGSIRNLSAMAMGASRMGTPSQVDTILRQLGRVASGGAGPEWSHYLREELGVAAGTPMEQALPRIFEEMKKAQAQGVLPRDWAKTHGIGQAEYGERLEGMMRYWGEVQAEINRAPIATAATAQQAVSEYRASPAGQQRAADVNLETARAEAGMRGERMRQIATEAEARLTRERPDLFGPEGIGATVMQNYVLGKFGTSVQDMAMHQMMGKVAEEQLGQRMPSLHAEPTMAADLAAGVAAAPAAAIFGALGLFGYGAQGRENIATRQRQAALKMSGVGGTAQLALDVAAASDLRAIPGAYDAESFMMGPLGKRTAGEYETYYRAQHKPEQDIQKLISTGVAALQRGLVRPLVSPGTGKTPTR